MNYYNKATKLVTNRQNFERDLLFAGIYNFKRKNPKSWEEEPVSPSVTRFNEILATAAKLMADEDQDLRKFESYAKCLGRAEKEVKTRPKYRPMNGYGNNLKHPYYGTPNMPFGRFAPKNYDDGINAIRKSASGSDLPTPRQIVQEVLLKAEQKPRLTPKPNFSLVTIVLYVSHDLANKANVEALEEDKEIRCCARGRKKVLSSTLSNAACAPMSIGEKDPFYSKGGIRCLNAVRSETSSYPSKIQYGEIMNRATAFMDHSVIYGNNKEDNKRVRTGKGGKLNLGTMNLLPVDNEGRFITSSNRFWQVLANSAVWPVIFSRIHNILADGLKAVNSHWDDETLFQEARRINIAWLQQTVFESDVLNVAFNKSIKEQYSETRDPATTLEFNTAAYRFLHYFSPSTLMMTDKKFNSIEYPISDVIGNFSFAEQNFDDLTRGLFNQGLNFAGYTDEVSVI